MTSVNISADMPEPKLGHVWRADDGTIHASIRFGDRAWPYLMFDSPTEARALAAVCTEAAEAMDRLAAEEKEAGDG